MILYLGLLSGTAGRVNQVLMLPLLVLDCLGSVFIRERFGATLSAKAWDARTHTQWYWTHRFIDGMPWFGRGHCQLQFQRELKYGSVWAAWLADWRAA